MLRRYELKDKVFEFVTNDSPRDTRNNTFTILVGKNGTGKSRLLRSLVKKLVNEDIDYNVRHENPSMFEGELFIERSPSKVICVSTSPFDKFPILSAKQYSTSYSYLGVRGLAGRNFGLTFVSRIVHTLIEFALSGKGLESLLDILNYLDYQRLLKINVFSPNSTVANALLESENPDELLDKLVNISFPAFGGDRPNIAYLQSLDRDYLWRVLFAAKRLLENGRIGRAFVTLSRSGVQVSSKYSQDSHDFLLLASSSLLPIRDVLLYKNDSDTPIKFSEASSGEQSVLMTMLGIGCRIENNALICIDEPELCLHPEWQEKFIEILFHTFSVFHGCHFLIATHSPQIIAQLPRGKCYVMAVETGIAKGAEDFSERSADFQLAEIFNAPGTRNEYLSRVALNLFARLSKSKTLNPESLEKLELLSRIFHKLKENDPLRDLIESILMMAERYGRHI